jgi:hypothetical protein
MRDETTKADEAPSNRTAGATEREVCPFCDKLTRHPCQHATEASQCHETGEGYRGIAHDFETMRLERDRLREINAELLAALKEAEKHLKGEQNVAAQMAYGFIRAAIAKAKP